MGETEQGQSSIATPTYTREQQQANIQRTQELSRLTEQQRERLIRIAETRQEITQREQEKKIEEGKAKTQPLKKSYDYPEGSIQSYIVEGVKAVSGGLRTGPTKILYEAGEQYSAGFSKIAEEQHPILQPAVRTVGILAESALTIAPATVELTATGLGAGLIVASEAPFLSEPTKKRFQMSAGAMKEASETTLRQPEFYISAAVMAAVPYAGKKVFAKGEPQVKSITSFSVVEEQTPIKSPATTLTEAIRGKGAFYVEQATGKTQAGKIVSIINIERAPSLFERTIGKITGAIGKQEVSSIFLPGERKIVTGEFITKVYDKPQTEIGKILGGVKGVEATTEIKATGKGIGTISQTQYSKTIEASPIIPKTQITLAEGTIQGKGFVGRAISTRIFESPEISISRGRSQAGFLGERPGKVTPTLSISTFKEGGIKIADTINKVIGKGRGKTAVSLPEGKELTVTGVPEVPPGKFKPTPAAGLFEAQIIESITGGGQAQIAGFKIKAATSTLGAQLEKAVGGGVTAKVEGRQQMKQQVRSGVTQKTIMQDLTIELPRTRSKLKTITLIGIVEPGKEKDFVKEPVIDLPAQDINQIIEEPPIRRLVPNEPPYTPEPWKDIPEKEPIIPPDTPFSMPGIRFPIPLFMPGFGGGAGGRGGRGRKGKARAKLLDTLSAELKQKGLL